MKTFIKDFWSKYNFHNIIIMLLVTSVTFTSCEKDFLDKKPNKSLLIPTSLSDFEKLLDNISIMNITPGLPMLAGDEFYTTDAGILAFSTPAERNSYIWAKDIYENQSANDWWYLYRSIFYANIVLEGLEDIKVNSLEYNNIKGRAHFHRALSYFLLSQTFCPIYSPETSKTDLGLPLRLSASINSRPHRSNLEDTYSQIFKDIDLAESLLPNEVAYKNRPNKKAVFALKARIYQSMSNHDEAAKMATKALSISDKLIDFNTLTANFNSSSNPFPPMLPNANEETIFLIRTIAYSFNSSINYMVDSSLLKSYADNDLRKPIYFFNRSAGVVNHKGHYGGSSGVFFGLANDELYFIIAESAARAGELNKALNYLNSILVRYMKKGTFTPYELQNQTQLLQLILNERKKSLFRRGVRWTDLKRLNLDPLTAVTIKRVVNGQTYILEPNSFLYIFPIPENELIKGSVEQNPGR